MINSDMQVLCECRTPLQVRTIASGASTSRAQFRKKQPILECIGLILCLLTLTAAVERGLLQRGA